MSDNFRFDIAGASLSAALGIATTHYSRVKGWRVETLEGKPPRLILYWTEAKNATPLPAPLEGEAIVTFVRAWLDATKASTDTMWHDVETGQGNRVYNEDWGHIGSDHSAFVAIEPYLLLYGK